MPSQPLWLYQGDVHTNYITVYYINIQFSHHKSLWKGAAWLSVPFSVEACWWANLAPAHCRFPACSALPWDQNSTTVFTVFTLSRNDTYKKEQQKSGDSVTCYKPAMCQTENNNNKQPSMCISLLQVTYNNKQKKFRTKEKINNLWKKHPPKKHMQIIYVTNQHFIK